MCQVSSAAAGGGHHLSEQVGQVFESPWIGVHRRQGQQTGALYKQFPILDANFKLSLPLIFILP